MHPGSIKRIPRGGSRSDARESRVALSHTHLAYDMVVMKAMIRTIHEVFFHRPVAESNSRRDGTNPLYVGSKGMHRDRASLQGSARTAHHIRI